MMFSWVQHLFWGEHIAKSVVKEKMLSLALSLGKEFAMGLRLPEMKNILKVQSAFTYDLFFVYLFEPIVCP